METILGLCIGVGLSAACGFRIFVPLLMMSIATLLGWYEPAKGFEWLAIPSVCAALGFATICEIAAYYVPWVDNLLDTIATPAAESQAHSVRWQSVVEKCHSLRRGQPH